MCRNVLEEANVIRGGRCESTHHACLQVHMQQIFIELYTYHLGPSYLHLLCGFLQWLLNRCTKLTSSV